MICQKCGCETNILVEDFCNDCFTDNLEKNNCKRFYTFNQV